MATEDEPKVTPRELLLMLVLSPLLLVVGMHLAAIGWAAYRYLKIPYIMAIVLLFAALMTPLFLLFQNLPLLWPIVASAIVLIILLIQHLTFSDHRSLIEGANAEYLAPAHIVLLLIYLLFPSLNEAAKVAGM